MRATHNPPRPLLEVAEMTTCPSCPPAFESPRTVAAVRHRWWRRAVALLAAGLLVATLAACGTTTQGPPGPPGADGEDGIAGPPGADGEDGVANVIYSEWISFETANWSAPVDSFGFTERRYDVAVPQLDAAILDEGLVFVYVRFGNGFQFMLPYVGAITTIRDQLLQHRVSAGQIRIVYANLTDRDIDPGTIGSGNVFRYVLVPGGVPAAAALESSPHAGGALIAAGSTGAAAVEHGGR
jgi:hypothetical protein